MDGKVEEGKNLDLMGITILLSKIVLCKQIWSKHNIHVTKTQSNDRPKAGTQALSFLIYCNDNDMSNCT